MSWLNIRVPAPVGARESVCDLLESLDAVAVTVEDAAGGAYYEPEPHAVPAWARVRVTGLFASGVDVVAIRAAIESAAGIDPAEVVVERLEDRDWEREWQRRFVPVAVGERLWVGPRGFEPPAAAVGVQIDPGLAFGTGTHATTRLCLQYLSELELTRRELIDYGCGSGILAIAALKCGAARAWGVDIDPRALATSAANAEHNAVSSCFTACYPHELPQALSVDLVIANILSDTLIRLAPTLGARVCPGGDLALSGILAPQADAVARAFAPEFVFETRAQQEWVLLVGTKPGPRDAARRT